MLNIDNLVYNFRKLNTNKGRLMKAGNTKYNILWEIKYCNDMWETEANQK